MSRKNSQSTIEALWREHCAAPFPDGLAGEEVAGICVVSLDTFAAGCIATVLSGEGRVDAERIAVLSSCHRDLSLVVAQLNGEPRQYFARLEKLANMILKAGDEG